MKPGLDKTCPTCGQEPGTSCRAGSGRVTDTHQARFYGVKVSKANELRVRKPKGENGR